MGKSRLINTRMKTTRGSLERYLINCLADPNSPLTPLGKVWDDAVRCVACKETVKRYAAGDVTAEQDIRGILASDRHRSYAPMCEAIALSHFGIIKQQAKAAVRQPRD